MSPLPAARLQAHPCDTCTVQSTFCALGQAARDAFDKLKTSVSFRGGEVVFHEADPCQSIFVVCTGRVKLVTASKEGRLLLLRFVEPGEILGLAEAVLGGTPYECSGIASEPSVLAIVPRDTFVRFVSSYPAVACRVTVALSHQYKKAQREEKFLGLRETSVVRLAQLLLEWSEQRGTAENDGVHIPLHVTHNDLAQAIGATRETVTRILGDLNHRGIVGRTANEIVIHSPVELTRISLS